MSAGAPTLAGERRLADENADSGGRASSAALISEELFGLFQELQLASYRVDASHLAAAQKLVLDVLAQEGMVPVRRLRTLLAPVFAKTSEQQADFYRRFEAWLNRIGGSPAIARPVAPQPSSVVVSGQTKGVMRHGRRWPVVASITAALLALGLAVAHWQTSRDRGEMEAAEQVAAPLPNGSLAAPTIPEQPSSEWVPDESEQQSPDLRAREKARVGKLVEEPRPLITAARVVLVLLPLAGYGGWLFLRWRRRQLWLERRRTGEPADVGRLRIAASFDRLFTSPPFRRSAQNLRRAHRVATRHLDVERTVAATAAQAGLFAPVYEQRPQTPEYLFLIEHGGAYDHVARLFDEAVERLRDEGVFIDRYYFFGDPRLCYPDDAARTPIALKELAARLGDHRLLVVGTADGFFHPVTGELEGWLEQFEGWTSRAVISTRPRPLDRWSLEEIELLEQGFSLATATPRGISAVAERVVLPVEGQEATILDGYPPAGAAGRRVRREQLTKRAADLRTKFSQHN